MRRPVYIGSGALALGVLAGSASCALVLGYDDYTEGASSATTSAGSSGGGGGANTGQGGAGTGGAGTGGALPPLQATWSYRGGDEQIQAFNAVAFAPSGDIVVAGDFEGTMDVLGESFTASTGFDLVAAQISASTNLPVWVRGTLDPDTGTSVPRFGTSIVADANGHVYISGLTAAGSANQGFLARIDVQSGLQTWLTTFDAGGGDATGRVVLDSEGRIRMVAGAKDKSFTFGAHSSAGVPGATGEDIALVTCEAPPCSTATISILGGASAETVYAIAADPTPGAAVLLTGTYRGTWGNLPESGAEEGIFVVKVDGSSAPVWTTGFVKTQNTSCIGSSLELARGRAIAATTNGDVVVAGVICGDTDFGNGIELAGKGGADAFVARLDRSNGKVIWARSFGDPLEQMGTGVAVGKNGMLYVCGTFSGTVDFGAGNVLEAGPATEAMFLAELSSANGETRRVATFGHGESVGHRLLQLAASETSIVLAGTWTTALTFGDGATLAPHGALDAFLVTFTP